MLALGASATGSAGTPHPTTWLQAGTHMPTSQLQIVMTNIGGMCLITIGTWVLIELAVTFGHYGHQCIGGEGEQGVQGQQGVRGYRNS